MQILEQNPSPFETVTAVCVDNWFKQKFGDYPKLSSILFKIEADKYGINWIGVFLIAVINTKNFESEFFKTNKSLMAENGKLFFSYEESIKALVQYLAILGGAPSVKSLSPAQFILPTTAILQGTGLMGAYWHFEECVSDRELFSRCVGEITTHCQFPFEESQLVLEEKKGHFFVPSILPKVQLSNFHLAFFGVLLFLLFEFVVYVYISYLININGV